MQQSHGIQRVSILYRPENLSRAIREFIDVLGITDLDGPHALHTHGMRVAISWNHGIELIAPLEHGTHSAELWKVLWERGEGLYRLVYRVEDLHSSERRACMYGHPRAGEYIDMSELHRGWRDRFEINIAAPMAPFAGVPVTLIQVEEKEHHASSLLDRESPINRRELHVQGSPRKFGSIHL